MDELNGDLQSTEVEELSRFFKKMGWFVDKSEIAELVRGGIHKYFEDPANAPPNWSEILKAIFVSCLHWTDTLHQYFRKKVDLNVIEEKTKVNYARRFVHIVNFVVNDCLARRQSGSVSPHSSLVDDVFAAPTLERVLDLVDGLMRERVTGAEPSVLEALMRGFALKKPKKPGDVELKDPRDIQPIATRLMALLRTSVLACSAKATGHGSWGGLQEAAGARIRAVLGESGTRAGSGAYSDADDAVSGVSEESEVDPFEGSNELMRRPNDVDIAMEMELEERCVYLNAKNSYPMSAIVQVWFEAQVHARKLSPRILVLEDGTTVSFDGRRIDMKCFSRSYAELLSYANGLAEELSMGVDTQATVDDFREDYSQGEIPLSEQGKRKLQKLVEALANQPGVFAVDAARGKCLLVDKFKHDFFDKYDNLVEAMLALVHIGGGMPARGSELARYKFRDFQGGRRNVFLFHGHVYFEPTWQKNSWTLADLPQFRFLDQNLSKLVLRVFGFLSRVAHLLAKASFAKYTNAYLSHVFVSAGKPMSSNAIRSSVSAHISRAGVNLAFADLRHLLKFCFNMAVMQANEEREPPPGHSKGDFHGIRYASTLLANNFACRQAGHSEDTGSGHYARTKGSHDCFNDVQFLGQLFVSAWCWERVLHADKAVTSRVVDGGSLVGSGRTEPSQVEVVELATQRVRELQSQAQFVAMVDPRAQLNLPHIGDKLRQPRDAHWAECLDAPDYSFLDGLRLGNAGEIARRHLQALFPGTTWRSAEQLHAVKMSLSDLNFLSVISTGGGKSLTFFITAREFVDQVTLVLVPTRTLKDDLLRRAGELGIRCGDVFNDKARGLVVMTYKMASMVFKSVIAQDFQRIKRVFIDEAHELGGIDEDVASDLRSLAVLRPFTLLTATASGRVMTMLNRWSPSLLVHQIRASTDRPNIAYSVQRVSGNAGNAAWSLVKATLSRDATGRAIVFVPFKDEVEEMLSLFQKLDEGTKFGVVFLHGGLDDKFTPAAVWRDGGARVIVATKAFGPGVDMPSVRIVILAGIPWCVEDAGQFTGRAGRDGLPSRAVVLLNSSRELRAIESLWQLDPRGALQREATLACLSADACFRETLSLVMDGRAVHCKDSEGMALCGFCERTPSPFLEELSAASAVSAVDRRFNEEVLDEAEAALTEIRDLIDRKHGCAYCYTLGHDSSSHSLFDCEPLKKPRNGRKWQYSCLFCFDLVGFHSAEADPTCPFMTPYGQTPETMICGLCAVPSYLGRDKVHPDVMGRQCRRFSFKVYWILHTAAELRRSREQEVPGATELEINTFVRRKMAEEWKGVSGFANGKPALLVWAAKHMQPLKRLKGGFPAHK
jgi:superfamily II DNA helicase RecQ